MKAEKFLYVFAIDVGAQLNGYTASNVAVRCGSYLPDITRILGKLQKLDPMRAAFMW
jgi:hypothetical protein